MSKIYVILLTVAISFSFGYAVRYLQEDQIFWEIQEAAHAVCERRLADPHHCISICQEEFDKYGC